MVKTGMYETLALRGQAGHREANKHGPAPRYPGEGGLRAEG